MNCYNSFIMKYYLSSVQTAQKRTAMLMERMQHTRATACPAWSVPTVMPPWMPHVSSVQMGGPLQGLEPRPWMIVYVRT